MYAKIWPQPAAGTLEMAASPLGTSANFKPALGLKYPGNLPVISLDLLKRREKRNDDGECDGTVNFFYLK